MNTEDSEFERIEREQAMRGVPDAIHHTDTSESLEYITGWNDCRAEMLEQHPSTVENNGGKTGWPPGLLQDDCKGLSKWLSKQPDARRRVREALAEQPAQQEPVAVVSGYYGGQCVILPIDPARIFNSNTALYTSPPAQRKPLTDEEIESIFNNWPTYHLDHEEFARAIEAAHNIKENT